MLTRLGDTPAAARAAVRKFRQHDEKTLDEQYAIKEDEVKFIAATRESAQQLEELFESDAAQDQLARTLAAMPCPANGRRAPCARLLVRQAAADRAGAR